MKKIVALLLALALVLSMSSALAYSPEAPITIKFWHNRGSGAQETTVKGQVAAFNETVGKELGIVVEETYIGAYGDLLTKMQLAVQSNEQPAVSVLGNTRVVLYNDDGILEDMAPYAAKSGFDTANLFDAFMTVPGNTDGSLYSLPYLKSTPVLYYNKGMADEKGLTAPTTMEDFEAFCKALHTVDANGEVVTWGFESLKDFFYYQLYFMYQLGSGLWNEEGTASPALEDGNALKVIADWDRWVEEGWCRPYDSTNASATVQEMFYQGKVAAFWASCSSLSNVIKYCAEAGVELGIAYMPTYDVEKNTVAIGGGQIGLIGMNNSEEIKQAGWEFINFLMSDDQVAYNAINSGYLPTTKSVSDNEAMKGFWAENPLYKVAYDQLAWGTCQEYPYFLGNNELNVNIHAVLDAVIQEQTLSAEDAVAQIWEDNKHLFEN